MARATATASRWRCPPESVQGSSQMRSISPTARRAPSTRAVISVRGRHRFCRGKATSSWTARVTTAASGL